MKYLLIRAFLGSLAILTGLGFILPSVAKLRDYGALSVSGLLFLGVVLAFGGAGLAFSGIIKARRLAAARKSVPE